MNSRQRPLPRNYPRKAHDMSSEVPNTINDKAYADLQRRAQKAAPPMFDSKAVKQRLASNAQRGKAQQS